VTSTEQKRRYRAKLKIAGLTARGTIPLPNFSHLTLEERRKRYNIRTIKWRRAKRQAAKLMDSKKSGPMKATRIDLGLDILRTKARPGVPMTLYEIAAWAGCTIESIRKVEQQAFDKLRPLLAGMVE